MNRLMAVFLSAFAISCHAQPTANVEGDRSIMLPVSSWPATLQDCDRAWEMDGKRRPRRAIVVNRTLCEPRTPCQYGGQVYLRTCYGVGDWRKQGQPFTLSAKQIEDVLTDIIFCLYTIAWFGTLVGFFYLDWREGRNGTRRPYF